MCSHGPVSRSKMSRGFFYRLTNSCSMVSVTHGRPAMISQHPTNTVPLPTSATTNGQSTIQNPEYYSFFVRSVRLYEIIHKTMIAFYSPTQSSRSKDKEAHSDSESADGEDEPYLNGPRAFQ